MYSLKDIEVVILLNFLNNKVLAVLRSKNDDVFPGMWFPVSGYRENGETLEDTARRELYEEIRAKLEGFREEDLVLLTSVFLFDKEFVVGVFLVDLSLCESYSPVDNPEVDEYGYIEVEKLSVSMITHGCPDDLVNELLKVIRKYNTK